MIRTDRIIYQAEHQMCEGYVSYDNSTDQQRPGILVAHTFRGQSAFEVDKSVELAKLGYVAFAMDLYGQGKRASTPEAANQLMAEFNADRLLLRNRMLRSLETLQKHEKVVSTKIGAIGFCFGGKCVLDLARSGVPIDGVVSFHGIYDAPAIPCADQIQASILVLHGWDDPLARPSSVTALAEELTMKKADWQILAFGHTGHAFTNPHVHNIEEGMFFQSDADRRSWIAMSNFFQERFA